MAFRLTDLTSLDDLAGASAAGGGSAALPVTALGPGDTIEQAKGSVRRYSVPLTDPNSGAPLLGDYSGAEAVRAYLWEGGDGPAAATPAVSWDQSSPPLLYLDLGPADLAGLLEQPYPIRVEIDLGGFWQTAWQGFVDVDPEPAASPASLPVYGSYAELVRWGGNGFRQLLTEDQGAGFAVARAEARAWLDSIIIARYRPPGGLWAGGFGYALLGGLGVGAWNTLDTPNPVIKQYLDSDCLIVTDVVSRAVARKALGIIYGRQPDAEYAALADFQNFQAEQEVACLVAQLDINGDGYPEYSINCGVYNARNV